jgi:hypothetical protein
MTSEREEQIKEIRTELDRAECVLGLVSRTTKKLLALNDPEGRDIAFASDLVQDSLTVLRQALVAVRRVATDPIGQTRPKLPDHLRCEELARALEHLRPLVPIRPDGELRLLVRRPLPCRRDEDGESIPSGDEESGDSDDDNSMSSAETDTERGVVTENDEDSDLFGSDEDSDIFRSYSDY